VRATDRDGRELGPGGGELLRLHHVDLSGRDPRLDAVRLDLAVNWHNRLLGERGVARVFGPQKGATPEQVLLLEAGLTRLAAVLARDTGRPVADLPGAGASGGLGAGAHAMLGARLHPRYDVVMRYLDLDRLIDGADLVITAEGALDGQTPYGKVPAEVARRAKRRGLPVIALAGTLGADAGAVLGAGIDAFASILRRPCSLEEAIADAGMLLEDAASDAVRMVAVGLGLRQRSRGLPTRQRPLPLAA
jgi:glycerate kinase